MKNTLLVILFFTLIWGINAQATCDLTHTDGQLPAIITPGSTLTYTADLKNLGPDAFKSTSGSLTMNVYVSEAPVTDFVNLPVSFVFDVDLSTLSVGNSTTISGSFVAPADYYEPGHSGITTIIWPRSNDKQGDDGITTIIWPRSNEVYIDPNPANDFTISVSDVVSNDRLAPQNELEVSLFPNPASSHATLRFTQAFTGRLSVVSVQGKVLHRTRLDSSYETRLDLRSAGLAPGLYFVQLQNQETARTIRLTVL